MFCHKCGARIPEDSAFCEQCGAKISESGAGEFGAAPKAPKAPVPPKEPGYSAPRPAVRPAIPESGLSRNKIICLVGAVLIIIGLFLPYVSASAFGESVTVNYFGGVSYGGYSESSLNGTGLIMLLLAIAVIVFVFVKIRNSLVLAILAAVTGLLSLIAPLIDMGKLKSLIGSFASMGFGAILLIVASVILLIGAVLLFLSFRKKALH